MERIDKVNIHNIKLSHVGPAALLGGIVDSSDGNQVRMGESGRAL